MPPYADPKPARTSLPGLGAFAAAATFALGAGAPAVAHAAAAPVSRPNVVVVMTDDQDFHSMSALPNVRNLIGARGTQFTTSVVNYPLCAPSRVDILDGPVRAQPPHRVEQPARGRLREVRRERDDAGLDAARGLPDDPHRQVPQRLRPGEPDRGPQGVDRLARDDRPLDLPLLRDDVQRQREADTRPPTTRWTWSRARPSRPSRPRCARSAPSSSASPRSHRTPARSPRAPRARPRSRRRATPACSRTRPCRGTPTSTRRTSPTSRRRCRPSSRTR